MTRVFINGFGRIGRTLFRQILAGGTGLEIVGINDIAALDICAYLLRYDSVYGPLPVPVTTGPDWIEVAGRRIPFSQHRDLRALDLTQVDVVLECTGRASTREVAEAGRVAGARAVLVSGPSAAADVTVVMGANDADLGDARIVSNASCTTNAIAPLLRLLDDRLGIAHAHVTTIHCYTGSQPTVDAPGPSPERSRAAAVSMIPTTTSAAAQVTGVLPAFHGRLSISAVRVPCLSVSAIDAVIQTTRDLGDTPAPELLRGLLADTPLIGLTEDPCVSTDMRARPESLVVALPETMTTGPRQLRLLGWYDNEWGFSARMVDMARRMVART